MNYEDIPQLPRAHYEIDVPWTGIDRTLKDWSTVCEVRLDPDYQRCHVWTREQQRAYVEYMMRGGEVGRAIAWNSPGWPDGAEPIELVDGKQRLEAVRAFLRDDLPVFGGNRFSEFDGAMRFHLHRFQFRICRLRTRAEILDLYLNINAGGTPHTAEEIARVRALRAEAGR